MKNTTIILIFGAGLILCGCASVESGIKRVIDYTNKPLTDRDEAIQQQREIIKHKHDAVVMGNSIEKFSDAWGDPEYVDAMKNMKYLHYESYQGEPTVFIFEDGKLIGWQKDGERNQQIQAEESLKAQKEATRKQGIINMMNANKATNCTTTNVGRTAYTNCN